MLIQCGVTTLSCFRIVPTGLVRAPWLGAREYPYGPSRNADNGFIFLSVLIAGDLYQQVDEVHTKALDLHYSCRSTAGCSSVQKMVILSLLPSGNLHPDSKENWG